MPYADGWVGEFYKLSGVTIAAYVLTSSHWRPTAYFLFPDADYTCCYFDAT